MTPPVGSRYLRWAKLHRPSRYDLTSSGMPHLALADLPAPPGTLALGGTGAYGYGALGNAIARRYRVPADRVVQALGCSMANFLAMSALLGPADEVVIEHPAYEPLLSVARHLGASIRRFPRRAEDGFAIDPAEVARAVTARTRLIVITNLHNPSGAFTDDETLREIGRIAESAGARALVDEVYLDALFEAEPRTSAHLGDVFIATSSLTKVYGLAGLRCGWILAEPRLACRMWRMVEIANNIGAHPAEQLAAAAFAGIDAIAARSKAMLDANRDALNAFYRTRGDLEWTEHRAGSVSFPRLRRGSVRRLRRVLAADGATDIVPGAFFGMPDHFRIGLGVDPAAFAAGLERLGRALDHLDRTS
ncbi:pyridoxal phosphate-dependent aminotransferase [Longimicrobium sp.]|uniref:pyridoxal phosphate-dependent aminotransferase n=1 Tax=Longimicrobium sp. TaxID=2029185 RepID=UPI002C0FA8D0|nr:pyridoxal phosphate-dependent aminotransferase [Longimicrobium sp.]HSU16993.1 pyridoxal phosphate-dependent aminotransferase [Longimicrobium sp.]